MHQRDTPMSTRVRPEGLTTARRSIQSETEQLARDLREVWGEFWRGNPMANDKDLQELVAGPKDPRRTEGAPSEARPFVLEQHPVGERMAKHRDAYGVEGTLHKVFRNFMDSGISGTGLFQDRSSDALARIERARVIELDLREPRKLKFVLIAIGLLGIVGLPSYLLYQYGFNDADFHLTSNLAQFLEAGAAFATIFLGWWFAAVLIELRLRTRRALREIQHCRCLMQLIDSHALSHPDVARELVCAPRPMQPATPVELDSQQAVAYLLYAAALARIVAKTAQLYPQWLPRLEVTTAADELFQMSCEIEGSCVQRAEFIRARTARELSQPPESLLTAEDS
jgi:hypothetical protein